MSRPTDWSPLTGSDPFPGDPTDVAALGRRYAETAAEIAKQAASLTNLANGVDWVGEAGTVFRESATELSAEVTRAQGRYAEAGAQLTAWSPILDDAQRQSITLLHQAQDAQSRITANQTSSLAGIEEPTDADRDREAARSRRLEDARRDLQAVRDAFGRLRENVDADAKRVGDAIRAAAQDDLKDGFWDNVSGAWDSFTAAVANGWDAAMDWVRENSSILDSIATWCGNIAAVLGVVALILSATGILAPLGAVLAGLAIGLTAVSLVINTALAMAGEGSWLDVAFDVVGLLSFGLGRVAIKGVQAAYAGVKGAAAGVASTRAVTAAIAQHTTGLRIASFASRVPLGPIRNAALNYTQGVARAANQVGDDAARAVMDLPLPSVSWQQAVRALDKEFAQQAAAGRTLVATYGDDVAQQFAAFNHHMARATKATLTGSFVDSWNLPGLSDVKDWAGQPFTNDNIARGFRAVTSTVR